LDRQLAKQDAVDLSDDNDGAEGEEIEEEDVEAKRQRKQIKEQQKRVTELEQQATVLNNQIVAWEGSSATTESRIAELVKETGRLKDLRKSLTKRLETSRAEATRLGKVLEFWKAEADYAKTKNGN
jgi:pyruvate/2-oxoglutarate dehydrogenase complex dihydrolipoamide acyltransferase (E2) component